MDYLKRILSKNLQDMRTSRSLKQVEVAGLLEISPSAYNRWEKGGDWIGSESLPKLERLALFYGVRPSRFFYDPDMDNLEAKSTWSSTISPEIAKKLEELALLIKNS